MDGALGWAPIHNSAWGVSDGVGSPRSAAMAMDDPHEYVIIVFFKVYIDRIEVIFRHEFKIVSKLFKTFQLATDPHRLNFFILS